VLTDPAPSLERAGEGGGVVPANVPLYPHLQRRRNSRGEVEHNLLVVLGLSLPMQDGHKESNAGGPGESSGGEGTPDFPIHCPSEHQRPIRPFEPHRNTKVRKLSTPPLTLWQGRGARRGRGRGQGEKTREQRDAELRGKAVSLDE